MQRIKLYILLFIAIIWFMVIIPYFLAQTSFGANIIAQYISDNSTYRLSIGNISHSFGKPYELTLHNVILTDKQTEAQYLQAETLTAAINKEHPFSLRELDYIIIQKGHLNMTNISKTDEVIQAKLLQLLNVSVDIEDTDKTIKIENVKGGIQPWSMQYLSDKTTSFQFNFTAQTVNYKNIDIQSMILSGFQKNGTLFLNNIGGNINKGFFISKAKRLPDDDWIIDELQINHLNLQTELTFDRLQQILPSLPKFTLNYFALTDSSLDTPDLKIDKSNIEINNVSYDQQWNIQNATLLFNANHVVWQDEIFTEPMIQISAHNNQFTIQKAISSWQNGMFSFTGTWAENKLRLNNVLVSGIRYTLLENWQKTLQEQSLPDYFSDIFVKKLTIMPSNIIDTQVEFPMQYTFFEARGNNLQLIKQHRWGLWQGKLILKADHATINTATLRHVDLTLAVNNPYILVDLSALTDTGLLEATAQLAFTEQQIHDLNISGYSVDPALLTLWKIINTPISDNNFALQLAGKINPLQLSGQLTTKNFTGDVTYLIQNNHIILN